MKGSLEMTERTACDDVDARVREAAGAPAREKAVLDALKREQAASERLREQASALRDASVRLEQDRGHAEDELQRLRADNIALMAQADALVHQRDAVLASASWRVTAPLRRIGERLSPRKRMLAKQSFAVLLWPLWQWQKFGGRVPWKGPRPEPYQPSADERLDRPIAAAKQTIDPTSFLGRVDVPRITFLLRDDGDPACVGLLATLGSLAAQSAENWDAVIYGRTPASAIDSHIANQEHRLRYACEAGVPADLVSAVELATGEFVSVLDAGDELTADAVRELTAGIVSAPKSDIVYSDETGMNAQALPFLKPEWSPDLLYAFNYFGRITLLRRALLVKAGICDGRAGEAVEWDMNLRVNDLAQVVTRVPKILCRRADAAKDRPSVGSEGAADARYVIARYWKRHGFDATATTRPDGTQSSSWPLSPEPRVSVIVPTKDKPELMRKTAEGLLCETSYHDLELIIVDTGSCEGETETLYRQLRADPRVRILNYSPPFNYSAACNVGAAAASGSILLFLNNDIEVISADWLSDMVRFAQRPGVGCVGTKLIYPGGRLQHGGVVVGPHLAALAYTGTESEGFGVSGSADHPRNWLAVMGACQMVTREAFDSVGGFDEGYRIAMGDVGLCLKLWRAGYRTAYEPDAALVHHEGATRGHTNPIEDLKHLAEDIRSAGVNEDPFLHPELDGDSPTPRSRQPNQEGPGAALRRNIANLTAFLLPSGVFDLFDNAHVAAVLGDSFPRASWRPQSSRKIDGTHSAARWTIDLLRRRADLRARFPKALSEGSSGAFASWLVTFEADRINLPPSAREALASLFDADFGARARRNLLSRTDIFGRWPLGLTPINRRELFQWFFEHGLDEGELCAEEVWWLFLEAAEQPARELMRAYLLRPAWQNMFPDAASPFGADRFARWVRSVHRVNDSWLDPSRWWFPGEPADQLRVAWYGRESWRQRFPLALRDRQVARAFLAWLASDEAALEPWSARWLELFDQDRLADELIIPGLTILGHFRYPSGLRVSAEALADGIVDQGGAVSLRDVPAGPRDDTGRERFLGLESHDITLVHVQPEPFFEDAFERAGLGGSRPQPYRIACWYWEFDTVPEIWNRQAILVDEIWAATSFVAEALRARLDVPVHTLFPGVRLPNFAPRSRNHFGLPDDETLFLFAFHMASVMERKNPLGLIRAFRRAFTPDDRARLVLKVSFGNQNQEELDRLKAAAAGARITIIDEVFSLEDVYALMDACDVYVSLHRSEGLGLTMAEAMMMGKPVIATGYSGNMEFMSPDNSLLVDFELRELDRPIPPYEAGYRWADPDEAHAARLMRELYENPEFARRFGEKVQADARETMSVHAAGRRVLKRLTDIRASSIRNGGSR